MRVAQFEEFLRSQCAHCSISLHIKEERGTAEITENLPRPIYSTLWYSGKEISNLEAITLVYGLKRKKLAAKLAKCAKNYLSFEDDTVDEDEDVEIAANKLSLCNTCRQLFEEICRVNRIFRNHANSNFLLSNTLKRQFCYLDDLEDPEDTDNDDYAESSEEEECILGDPISIEENEDSNSEVNGGNSLRNTTRSHEPKSYLEESEDDSDHSATDYERCSDTEEGNSSFSLDDYSLAKRLKIANRERELAAGKVNISQKLENLTLNKSKTCTVNSSLDLDNFPLVKRLKIAKRKRKLAERGVTISQRLENLTMNTSKTCTVNSSLDLDDFPLVERLNIAKRERKLAARNVTASQKPGNLAKPKGYYTVNTIPNGNETTRKHIFICNECGKELSTRSSMSFHLRIHRDEYPLIIHAENIEGPPYKCPNCNVRLKKAKRLKKHCIRVHNLVIEGEITKRRRKGNYTRFYE